MGLVMTDGDEQCPALIPVPITYIRKGPDDTDTLCFYNRSGDIPDMSKVILAFHFSGGIDHLIEWAEGIVSYAKTIKSRRALINRG